MASVYETGSMRTAGTYVFGPATVFCGMVAIGLFFRQQWARIGMSVILMIQVLGLLALLSFLIIKREEEDFAMLLGGSGLILLLVWDLCVLTLIINKQAPPREEAESPADSCPILPAPPEQQTRVTRRPTNGLSR
jgi:hypothetical protein